MKEIDYLYEKITNLKATHNKNGLFEIRPDSLRPQSYEFKNNSQQYL